LQKLFKEAREKEQQANETPLWKMFANWFTRMYMRFDLFDDNKEAAVAAGYRMAKLKYFEQMEKVRDVKNQIRADIAEFAKRVQNSQTESELSDITIEALKDVVFGLSQVAATMDDAVKYWKEMHLFIEHLKESKYVEIAMNDFSEEDRNEILYSKHFREEVLQNYAQWTATKLICTDFSQRIKPVRKFLREVIVERPLNEKESLAKARQIASELEKNIKNIRSIDYEKDEL
jgi:hypothetical protein